MTKACDERVDVKDLITKPEPLHRFVDKMGDRFHSAVEQVIFTGRLPFFRDAWCRNQLRAF